MKKQKKEYIHKMIMEYTQPKNDKTYMRATVISGDKEITFEGELKKTGQKLNKLPNNYHIDLREDTNQYFWYYLGRKVGKKDVLSDKYFKKYDDAVSDAIKHFDESKKKK